MLSSDRPASSSNFNLQSEARVRWGPEENPRASRGEVLGEFPVV